MINCWESAIKSKTIESKINKFKKFWNQEEVDYPIIGFWIGSYLPIELFKGAKNIEKKSKITPSMISFKNYIKDYKDFFLLDEIINDDLIRVGQAFWGIPWLEAIFGCNISSSSDTIWAKESNKKLEELLEIKFHSNNLWFQKLIEFENKLIEKFGNEKPISTTLMRGPSDILATILKMENFILSFYDNPDLISKVLSRITDYWIEIGKKQLKYIPPFKNGQVIGFYNIWAPGEAILFQEDAVSLLSPDIYEKYIFELDKRISKSFKYSLLHLHPESLHSIEKILKINELNAINVNINSSEEVSSNINIFKEILKYKPLLLWGLKRKEDIRLILNKLDPSGLIINITAPSIEEALKIKRSVM